MTSKRSPKIEMKTRILAASILFLAALTVVVAGAPAQQGSAGQSPAKPFAAPAPADQARILDTYGKLPLSFEANRGQADAPVKFLSHTSAYSLFLTGDEAVLTLSGNKSTSRKTKTTETNTLEATSANPAPPHAATSQASAVLRMKLRNANPAARITGEDQLTGTSNYFIGNDPSKWRTSIPTYAKVKYEEIYSGIDLVYYGNQRQLEYDFIVAPFADPHRIAFDIRGVKRIRRDEHGDLILKMREGEIRWHKPLVYQEKNGTRQEIAARYSIVDKNRVAFEVSKYDVSKALYIDPLIYSTYLGGNGADGANAIAVDSAGNSYIVGSTSSTNFPITPGAFQTTCAGICDPNVFVAKIDPSGSTLVYATYLGGSLWDGDWGYGIAVDGAGNAYVTGLTESTNFPTTPGAFQTGCGGSGCQFSAGDAFVSKISPTGSALVYSTYLGGSSYDFGHAIAVDSGDNAYVTGITYSTDFPTTPGALQTTCGGGASSCNSVGDAFVTKLNSTGSALVYSTYLGGSAGDQGNGIAVDGSGNAYVAGWTGSTDFPTMNALQSAYGGSYADAFVSKINSTGTAFVYSTYLGGIGPDFGYGIALDSGGNAYVTGATGSTNFPITPGAFQTVCNGGSDCAVNLDAFVTKISSAGTELGYSTYLGGSGFEGYYPDYTQIGYSVGGIAVDAAGSAYVTGLTASGNFPLENPFQKTNNGFVNVFVSKVNPAGSALDYSTYLGGNYFDWGLGIALDSTGNAYVAGQASSTDFPTKNPLQAAYGGGQYDAFVAKLLTAATSTTLASSLNPSIYGQKVTWTATVTGLGAVTPTGRVKFTWSIFTIGAATLNSSGVATLTLSKLNADPYPLTANYQGDANHLPSASAVLNQVIEQTTSAATLTSSPNPSTQGQAVTFTAKITSPTTVPTGPVTFSVGKTVLGTVELSGGKATFSTSTLAVGTTDVTVTFPWNSDIAGSSASVNQVVDQ